MSGLAISNNRPEAESGYVYSNLLKTPFHRNNLFYWRPSLSASQAVRGHDAQRVYLRVLPFAPLLGGSLRQCVSMALSYRV